VFFRKFAPDHRLGLLWLIVWDQKRVRHPARIGVFSAQALTGFRTANVLETGAKHKIKRKGVFLLLFLLEGFSASELNETFDFIGLVARTGIEPFFRPPFQCPIIAPSSPADCSSGETSVPLWLCELVPVYWPMRFCQWSERAAIWRLHFDGKGRKTCLAQELVKTISNTESNSS
jgi:hypothetical protein